MYQEMCGRRFHRVAVAATYLIRWRGVLQQCRLSLRASLLLDETNVWMFVGIKTGCFGGQKAFVSKQSESLASRRLTKNIEGLFR